MLGFLSHALGPLSAAASALIHKFQFERSGQKHVNTLNSDNECLFCFFLKNTYTTTFQWNTAENCFWKNNLNLTVDWEALTKARKLWFTILEFDVCFSVVLILWMVWFTPYNGEHVCLLRKDAVILWHKISQVNP